MVKNWLRSLFFILSLAACGILSLVSAGCASGGYKLTRQYARWVNSKNIVLRIVLYLLTSVVFAVTLLIDVVVFNTMDFWEGRVSAGSYEFEQGDKIFHVYHQFLPGSQLKSSSVRVESSQGEILQKILIQETPSGEIEMFVDGNLKTRVQGVQSIPTALIYDQDGNLKDVKRIFGISTLALNQ